MAIIEFLSLVGFQVWILVKLYLPKDTCKCKCEVSCAKPPAELIPTPAPKVQKYRRSITAQPQSDGSLKYEK